MDAKKDYNAIGNLTIEEISPGLLQDIKDIAVEVAGIEEANTTSFDASKYKQGHIMYLVDDVQEAIDKLTDLVDNTASSTEDGLMSKTDKIKLDGVEAGANKYVHPSSHYASMITESSSKRFVSDTEKSTWNAKASTAVATTSSNGLMSSTDKSKLDSINIGATKIESSTTNGKIRINGTETTVYTHPTGTNPHGTTKADIGLGNVDNTSDLNKPISTAVQTALNGKANSSHTHTSANISDATNANTANMIVKRDASGNFSAGTITATLSGNASTATKLQNSRTINGVIFDGTSNITIVDNTKLPLSGGTLTGVLNTNSQIKSTLATGTAPFTVASTTLVSNLNADLLDGLNSSSFFRTDASNSYDVRFASADGRGVRFWDSDNYKIYMSIATHATHGGRMTGETTSDYNMYFKMSTGTNRGFVWQGTSGKIMGVDGNGDLRVKGSVTVGDNKVQMQYNSTTDALDFVFV